MENWNTGFPTGFKWKSTCFVICTKFTNQFRSVSSFYGGKKLKPCLNKAATFLSFGVNGAID